MGCRFRVTWFHQSHSELLGSKLANSVRSIGKFNNVKYELWRADDRQYVSLLLSSIGLLIEVDMAVWKTREKNGIGNGQHEVRPTAAGLCTVSMAIPFQHSNLIPIQLNLTCPSTTMILTNHGYHYDHNMILIQSAWKSAEMAQIDADR